MWAEYTCHADTEAFFGIRPIASRAASALGELGSTSAYGWRDQESGPHRYAENKVERRSSVTPKSRSCGRPMRPSAKTVAADAAALVRSRAGSPRGRASLGLGEDRVGRGRQGQAGGRGPRSGDGGAAAH